MLLGMSEGVGVHLGALKLLNILLKSVDMQFGDDENSSLAQLGMIKIWKKDYIIINQVKM